MSELDQLFRDGLGNRKPEVPADLWKKIKANRATIPEGDALDQLFATTLANRQAAVPRGMWARIVAAHKSAALRRYAAMALLLLLTLAGGSYLMYDSLTTPLTDNEPGAPQVQASGTAAVVPPARPNQDRTGLSGAIDLRGTFDATAAVSAPVKASPSVSTEKSVTSIPARAEFEPQQLATGSVATLPPTPLLLSPLPFDLGPISATAAGGFRASGRHRLQGELVLGAAYAHQRFGLQAQGAQAQRELREVSEFPEVSYQLSARLRYRLGGSWRLVTGLTYTELRNQFEYESMLQGNNRLLRSNNRLRLLEVPLLASYELPGRRLRVSINAGPLLHYTAGVSGHYLDPASARPRELATAEQYRRQLGLGWTTSLTTTYPIGKQRSLELLVEPFFKQYTGSFTAPDAALSEHYWMGGLQLGLRKQLR
ncbi:hypothetical protein [Neolewinella sp.]|uniref:hypothetical protein n=1 Tax=Neolewinella sp. TaxID=2993543 RepID=UPI003B524FDC